MVVAARYITVDLISRHGLLQYLLPALVSSTSKEVLLRSTGLLIHSWLVVVVIRLTLLVDYHVWHFAASTAVNS